MHIASLKTSNSIRILCYLENMGYPLITIHELATGVGVSYPEAQKLVTRLRQENLIEATPGRTGGVRLARPGSEISVYDVYRVTEGDVPIVECLVEGTCRMDTMDCCGLRCYFQALRNNMIEQLSMTKIGDLV